MEDTSPEDILETQLAASITKAIADSQQGTDHNHCLLIRFYSNLQTVNSQAYQSNAPVGSLPSRDDLVKRAALHMYAGKTDGSYFISFSEDIQALLDAISAKKHGPEVSWAVRGIIKGMKPEFYGKSGMDKISRAPAQYVGIFRVSKANVVRWSDADLTHAVYELKKDPNYQDLKSNFQAEHEVVAYYPGQIEAPVKQLDNPFYPHYMNQVKK